MGTHPIFESDFDCLTEKNKKKIYKMDLLKSGVKSIRKVGKRKSKKVTLPSHLEEETPIRRCYSNPNIAKSDNTVTDTITHRKSITPIEKRRHTVHPSQQNRNYHQINQEKSERLVSVSTQTDHSHFPTAFVAEKLEESKEEPKKQTDLHPIYISVLLILVGFNFSAFVTSYDTDIQLSSILLSIVGGISVAIFLRQFIGLNLFK